MRVRSPASTLILLAVRLRDSLSLICEMSARSPAWTSVLLAVPLREMKVTYQSWEFDVFGEIGLISQRLFGGEESQVLSGDVRCRERGAVVPVLKDNTETIRSLCQFRDDACGACQHTPYDHCLLRR